MLGGEAGELLEGLAELCAILADYCRAKSWAPSARSFQETLDRAIAEIAAQPNRTRAKQSSHRGDHLAIVGRQLAQARDQRQQRRVDHVDIAPPPLRSGS